MSNLNLKEINIKQILKKQEIKSVTNVVYVIFCSNSSVAIFWFAIQSYVFNANPNLHLPLHLTFQKSKLKEISLSQLNLFTEKIRKLNLMNQKSQDIRNVNDPNNISFTKNA